MAADGRLEPFVRDTTALSRAVVIKVEALTKVFGASAALGGFSFEVKENEFLTVVGPSGCGKSTTLRLVAGLIPATAGKVYFRGVEVAAPIQDIGMVFQSPVLLPWRNTLRNVLFTAEMAGRRPAEYRRRALELIQLAGLGGFEKSYPHELSGGMQQRTAICRALLLNPALLLMDEPFGALDIMTREKMAFELQRIWSSNRTTVVFVTHSITEAVLLSDRIVAMTPRPGTTKAVVTVDLPRPRDVNTMSDRRFVEIAAAVRENIAAQWVE
ncbi:MAG TPA: ABC transporter ATP-binding protein [bacterium]|nr:ABC transporter ATP-binding protein [bacterium]